MLLGIALHSAVAYIDLEWIVVDSESSLFLGVMVAFVHCFRMPLFFLLSGFFTAMLWQKRGAKGVLKHRAKRILLPLALGCLTIVPAMRAVIDLASGDDPRFVLPVSKKNLWGAAGNGDLEQVDRFVGLGWPLDDPDPLFRQTPLAWAVNRDRVTVAERLIDSGADPNAKFGGDGLDTALHAAAFLGHADCARLLLDAGADANARNGRGQTPLDVLEVDREATEFVASVLTLDVGFREIQAGREEVKSLLVAAGTTRARTEAQAGGGIGEAGAAIEASTGTPIRSILTGLMYVPFFHHLWFLWVLCWLAVPLIVLSPALAALPRILRLPWWLLSSPVALLWLVPLTALTHGSMFAGTVIPGFGPDTSAGFLPIPGVFLHYAVFFCFGALVYHTPNAGERLGVGWPFTLLLGVPTFVIAVPISMMMPFGYELAGDEPTRRTLSALGQSLFTWLMVFGSAGICRHLLSAERPRLRYLSDSSYWLYLAHLPLIVMLQIALEPVPLPALAKFSLVVAASVALLLASYEWGVRYTLIGTLLNGPRTRSAPDGRSK